MLIKQVRFFCLPRLKTTSKILLIIFGVIIIQTLYIIKVNVPEQNPNNSNLEGLNNNLNNNSEADIKETFDYHHEVNINDSSANVLVNNEKEAVADSSLENVDIDDIGDLGDLDVLKNANTNDNSSDSSDDIINSTENENKNEDDPHLEKEEKGEEDEDKAINEKNSHSENNVIIDDEGKEAAYAMSEENDPVAEVEAEEKKAAAEVEAEAEAEKEDIPVKDKVTHENELDSTKKDPSAEQEAKKEEKEKEDEEEIKQLEKMVQNNHNPLKPINSKDEEKNSENSKTNNTPNKINNNNENEHKKGWRLDPKWEWCRNISIVYTWVNGSDPIHQEIKSHYNGGIKKADQRDRSMDELRYSLRSLELYLPWHEGMIYIVSPNQVPSWLNTANPRIKVIDQASLLPDEYNPTFNSFAIEFYLDKIPGLTERFIQLNDDYFFKKYVHPSFFFNSKRFPNFFYGRNHIHKGFDEAKQIEALTHIPGKKISWLKKYWGSVFYTNGVLQEKYGEDANMVMLQHAPYVWYRDIFEPMRQFYGKYITQTLSHKFRHPMDLIPTYAHQHYVIHIASQPDYKLPNYVYNNDLFDTANNKNQSMEVPPHPELDFGFYPHLQAEKTILDYGYRPLSRNQVRRYIRFGTVLDDKTKSMKLFNIIRKGPYLMFNLNDDYSNEEPGQWLLDFMNEMFPSPSQYEIN